jgi:hypothetical protein
VPASAEQALTNLLAVSGSQLPSPAGVSLNQPSRLRQPANGADLLIITRSEFLSAVEPLKALRQSQGLSVAVVQIEDIYDEFSFGNKTPGSLRDFITYAATSWKKKPRYVLLAGDASYDPRNHLGLGDFDVVPTKLIERRIHIERVPQHANIDDQSQRAELILLPFTIALPHTPRLPWKTARASLACTIRL